MNKNQRHRRMKAKRRECRLLYGVNRVQRAGIERRRWEILELLA